MSVNAGMYLVYLCAPFFSINGHVKYPRGENTEKGTQSYTRYTTRCVTKEGTA